MIGMMGTRMVQLVIAAAMATMMNVMVMVMSTRNSMDGQTQLGRSSDTVRLLNKYVQGPTRGSESVATVTECGNTVCGRTPKHVNLLRMGREGI